MKVLFIHNNFPAQFRNLAASLAKEPGYELAAIAASTAPASSIPGVKLLKYALASADVANTHPFARRFDVECRRAEQVLYNLSTLAASNFTPDVILAHPGWGETLPIRTMFPEARLIVYCEFFYGAKGRDLGFDPEFSQSGLDGHIGLQLKNATTLLALADADLGVSPTRWQHSTFPLRYQNLIQVMHDGVDTQAIRPDPAARLRLSDGRELTASDEVVTFVARNLEPLRGYHIFMRALPKILARRPNAHVVIIGTDGVSYGLNPPAGKTWKSIFFNEVRRHLDLGRVHYLGHVPRPTFLKALQVSSAHVYLTYPFVLSWSMLEAMSAGCLIIGSDTAPVREVIEPGWNGVLVPFFEVKELARSVIEALENRTKFIPMREAARDYVVEHFDAERICVPQMRRLLQHDPAPRAEPQPAELVPPPQTTTVAPEPVSERPEQSEPVPLARDALRNPFS